MKRLVTCSVRGVIHATNRLIDSVSTGLRLYYLVTSHRFGQIDRFIMAERVKNNG